MCALDFLKKMKEIKMQIKSFINWYHLLKFLFPILGFLSCQTFHGYEITESKNLARVIRMYVQGWSENSVFSIFDDSAVNTNICASSIYVWRKGFPCMSGN